MRQLACTARNIRHCVVDRDGDGDAKVVTIIEAVLAVMTREMEFTGTGVVQVNVLESSCRFDMSIDAAKSLRDDIDRWIADAERERVDLNFK